MRTTRSWILLTLLALVCTVASAQDGSSPEVSRVALNIEAQPIRSALQAFGKQTGIQVLYRSEDTAVGEVTTPRVTGTLSPAEALERLLEKTGLRYEFINARTVRISSGRPISTIDALDAQTRAALSDTSSATGTDAQNAKEQKRDELSEVVVSAEKRVERLLDVPVPVSAISADQLRNANKLRLSDYYTQVPSLSFAGDPAYGGADVSIRGLSSGAGYNNPTTAFTIDDVPYGSARADGGSYAVPEIDPGDLARLEVLRGPQGTLYGAASLGGLIKYVTIDPSLEQLGGDLSLGLMSTENGGRIGNKAYGALNVPLTDEFALRASAFSRTSPGYVEDPVRGADGIGEVRSQGVRLAALWRPSPVFSAKLGGFYQDVDQNGALRYANPHSPYDIDRGLGDVLGYLQQHDALGTGGTVTRNYGVNLTAHAQLRSAELTSISGFNSTYFRIKADATRDFLFATGATQDLFGPAVPNDSTQFVYDNANDLNKLAQELRLSWPLGQHIDALLGLFYTHEGYRGTFINRFADTASGAEVALLNTGHVRFRYEEWAAFTNVTVRVTERFDVQLGGRRSDNEGTYQGTDLGPQIDSVPLGPPIVGPNYTTEEHVSTYLFTPRYKLSENHMVYARFSTGYRPGGYNAQNDYNQPYPPYRADSSRNYELGYKGAILDDAVTIDFSLYRIDWKDMQLQVQPPGSPSVITENAGTARNRGVELSVAAHPVEGLSLSGWVAYTDAKLAADFPETSVVVGEKGERLPISTRMSGSLSITQELTLTSAVKMFAGASVTYVGERLGNFNPPDPFTGILPDRARFPSYSTVDVRLGLRTDLWTGDLYISNVADEHGIIYGDRDYLVPIRPRELGVNFTRHFLGSGR